MTIIPVNEPLLGESELDYVTECVRTGWVSSAGRFIGDFEENWAAYCGRRYGVAVSNGTAALQLAVASLDLAPGDEIIIPTFTIISCASAVINNSCVPVLVDSNPRTWCMDTTKVEDKITPRTRAIMAVHIYGNPVDMDALQKLATAYGLAIIEDSAEAHCAEYLSAHGTSKAKWRRCGSFGSLSCFSFYANKLITTGEGGMVLTDDSELAAKAQSLRNLCFSPERRFYHEKLGFNFRMTNLQAALGLAQLERIDEIVARKRWIGEQYTQRLSSIQGLHLQHQEHWARSICWMYGCVISEETGMNGEEFGKKLAEHGIQTRPFFLGMHEQPALRQRGLFVDERHPVSERLARQGLYLPSGLALTEAQLARVCEAVQEVLS